MTNETRSGTDLYATLGLTKTATALEVMCPPKPVGESNSRQPFFLLQIRRAYRSLAAKLHPDKHQGKDAGSSGAFQQVQLAFSVLSVAEKVRVSN